MPFACRCREGKRGEIAQRRDIVYPTQRIWFLFPFNDAVREEEKNFLALFGLMEFHLNFLIFELSLQVLFGFLYEESSLWSSLKFPWSGWSNSSWNSRTSFKNSCNPYSSHLSRGIQSITQVHCPFPMEFHQTFAISTPICCHHVRSRHISISTRILAVFPACRNKNFFIQRHAK
jgi:hypothetical protein